MHVSLTPRLEKLIQDKVATGLYNNASEVVREALRLMEKRDQDRETKLQLLRQALAVGETAAAEGRVTEFADKAEFERFFEEP